jgi:hypothetical protein
MKMREICRPLSSHDGHSGILTYTEAFCVVIYLLGRGFNPEIGEDNHEPLC